MPYVNTQRMKAAMERKKMESSVHLSAQRSKMMKDTKPPKLPKVPSRGIPLRMTDTSDGICSFGPTIPKHNYTDYREALLGGGTRAIASFSSGDKQAFMNMVASSKDLKDLVIENGLVKSLDEMEGIPKILLTVGSFYLSSHF